MAAALYPKAKDLYGEEGLHMLNDTIKVILVDTGTYTYSSAHDFLDDLSGTGGTAQTITSPTWVNGLFDGANVTFTAVAGTVSYEALVIYMDSGVAGTSPLIAFIDNFSAVTSNNGDITVTWNGSGIFQL